MSGISRCSLDPKRPHPFFLSQPHCPTPAPTQLTPISQGPAQVESPYPAPCLIRAPAAPYSWPCPEMVGPSSRMTVSFYWNSEMFIFTSAHNRYSITVKEREAGRREGRGKGRGEKGGEVGERKGWSKASRGDPAGLGPPWWRYWQGRHKTKGSLSCLDGPPPTIMEKALPEWAMFCTTCTTTLLLTLSR